MTKFINILSVGFDALYWHHVEYDEQLLLCKTCQMQVDFGVVCLLDGQLIYCIKIQVIQLVWSLQVHF